MEVLISSREQPQENRQDWCCVDDNQRLAHFREEDSIDLLQNLETKVEIVSILLKQAKTPSDLTRKQIEDRQQ